MANVKIPGIGEVPRGWAIAGAAGGGLFAIYLYRRQKSASAASSAATTPGSAAGYPAGYPSGLIGGDPYPPDGTTGNPSDPYSTDPTSGETYGDEASGYGGQSPYGGYGGYGGYPPYNPNPNPNPGPTTPTTPQEWAQQAVQTLGGLGWSQQTVAEACGAYIAGQELSADQASIIQVALSEVPYPGTAPPVKVTQTPKTVKVPSVIGERAEDAGPAIRAAGLVPQRVGNAVPRQANYVTSQTPKAGTQVAAGSTVSYEAAPKTAAKK